MIAIRLYFAKVLIPILITSILTSCSASTHLGRTSIKEPSLDDMDSQKWFLYYQDQFDGLDGNVTLPTERHSTVAREAYQKAHEGWQQRVEHIHKDNLVLILMGGAVVAGIIIGFVNMSFSGPMIK